MTDDSPQWLVLDRYLAGELTPAERERFEQWVALVPERHAWVESLRRITRETGTPAVRTAATDAAWQRIATRLGIASRATDAHGAAARSVDASGPQPVESRSLRRRAVRDRPRSGLFIAGALAASVALVGIAIVRSDRDRPIPTHRYATAPGEQAGITLSDGTSIVLGPASVLTVGSGFGHSARDVALDGEASFVVTHDARRPFTVHTAWAVMRDVGTSFIVRAYETDRRARVAVRDGAVSIMAPGADLTAATLHARQAALVDGQGRLVVGGATAAEGLLAWMVGRTVFNAVPLSDALRDLSREFGLQILVADSSLARLPVTASFASEPVDTILDDITAIVGARYTRSGRTILIRRRTMHHGSPVHAPLTPPESAAASRSR